MSVAEALARQSAPRVGQSHRGTRFSVTQGPTGAWSWKVLPANPQLHAYDYAIASGWAATREAAELAARNAIDAQSNG